MTPPPRPGRIPALLVAVWTVAFSLVHVYWLAGGRVGLPPGHTVWENVPLLVIDVGAVPALAVVAWLALALRRADGPSGRLVALIGVISGVLTVHFLPAVPTWWTLLGRTGAVSALDAEQRYSALLYEPWFAAGAVLLGLATVRCGWYLRSEQRAAAVPAFENRDLVPHV